jgi:hypothetical protein
MKGRMIHHKEGGRREAQAYDPKGGEVGVRELYQSNRFRTAKFNVTTLLCSASIPYLVHC